jgi:hypothetical protein
MQFIDELVRDSSEEYSLLFSEEPLQLTVPTVNNMFRSVEGAIVSSTTEPAVSYELDKVLRDIFGVTSYIKSSNGTQRKTHELITNPLIDRQVLCRIAGAPQQCTVSFNLSILEDALMTTKRLFGPKGRNAHLITVITIGKTVVML